MADYGTIKVNKVTYKNGSDADTDFNFKTDIVGTGTDNTFTANITIDNQKELRLGEPDGAGTNYVGFEAPDTIASNVIWKLPNADGSANYLLKTDGSGNLGWAADSATDSTKLPLAGGTLTGDITLNAQSDVRFADSDSSNYIALQAPATVASNVTFSLPAADGSANQLLKTDGSGNLGWATDAGASISVDNEWTKPQRGDVTVATHSSGATYDFDLDATNNFKLTISAAVELGFSNLDASREGQSGVIYIDNGAITPTWGAEVQFEGGTTLSITQSVKSILAYYVIPGGSKVLVTGILDVKDD